MKKKTITWVIILVVLGIIISLPVVFGKKKDKSINVRTANVEIGEISSYLNTTATIKSKNIKEYYGPQLKASKVNFKVGDSVKTGDVIVSYDVQDMNNSIKQAEIQYDNAVLQKQELTNQKKSIEDKKAKDVELKNSNKDLPNIDKINETSATSGALQSQAGLMEISEEKMKQADNSISLAKIALDSAKSKLSSINSNIVADLDGVITVMNVTEGAISNIPQPAVIVQDIDNLKALVSLGKYDASKVMLDQDAEIIVSGNRSKGKVIYIDPVAKKITGPTGSDVILNADVDILEKIESIKPEFDVDVEILLDKRENILKIPAEAIRSDKEGKSYTYIMVENKAIEKAIKLGLQSDMEVEIIEGLNEGDKVILNPTAAIKDGSLVKEAPVGDVK